MDDKKKDEKNPVEENAGKLIGAGAGAAAGLSIGGSIGVAFAGTGVGIPVAVVTTVGGFLIGTAVDVVRGIFK